jgi:hypothetical protein
MPLKAAAHQNVIAFLQDQGGGGCDVWRSFAIPHSWRKSQGLIVSKRCGTTQNIGPAENGGVAGSAEFAHCWFHVISVAR